jgi:hypothetical protein
MRDAKQKKERAPKHLHPLAQQVDEPQLTRLRAAVNLAQPTGEYERLPRPLLDGARIERVLLHQSFDRLSMEA